MELGKAMQNFTSSITGNNTKAVLCIRKAPDRGINQNNNNGIDAMGENPESIADDLINLDKLLLQNAEESLKGKKVYTWNDISRLSASYNYNAIEVQYNPSSLRLDTYAGKQMDFTGSNGRSNLSQYNAPSTTTMTLELLFDDTNNMDAFMVGDNPLTGFTPSNAINFGTSTVKNLKDGYSVQRQIQGLLSLLAVPTARDVIFFWGDMSFHGEITEAQASYTMFNKKGHPIRGKIQLNIRQGDYNAEEKRASDKKDKFDMQYWDKAFDETFKEAGAGGSMLDTVNKFTNNSMLNLKL